MTEANAKTVAGRSPRFKIAGGAFLEIWESPNTGAKFVRLKHFRLLRGVRADSFSAMVARGDTWRELRACFEAEETNGGGTRQRIVATSGDLWATLYGVPTSFLKTLDHYAVMEARENA